MATISMPFTDDAELLNLHGEMNGPINDKFSFNVVANYYHYTLAKSIMHGINLTGMENWD